MRILATILMLLCLAGECRAVTIGSESSQSLGTDGNFRLFIGNAPADGSSQSLNPPLFKWIYYSNSWTMGYPNATLQTFKFELSTNDNTFASKQWSIVTSNNFYNTLPCITNAAGSTWTGSNWWRVGYGDSNAANFVWVFTNSFSMPSSATKWDRSQYADTNYLIQLGIQHPHMFFTTNNRAAMATFLHTNAAMAFQWLQFTNEAYQTTTNVWWNLNTFTNQEPANWSGLIAQVCLAYQIDSNAFWKGVNPGGMTSWLATNFIVHGEDMTDPNGISEATKMLALCYDWSYDDMTVGQRSNVLWTLEKIAQYPMFVDWWYNSGVNDPNRLYTNALVVNYDSGSKAGGSHARVDWGLGLYCSWAGMGESALLRDYQTYFLNYGLGQVDPFYGDEGRGYAEQSWRTLHNMAAQLLLACNDARMTNNPWFTKYPKMFCYWEPLNYTELQSQFGDFGLQLKAGKATTYQYDYKYYGVAIMNQSGPIIRQHTRNFPIRSDSANKDYVYGNAFLPFYFPTIPAESDWPDTYYFDETDGWCMSYAYPPNDWNCFTNGVGFILTARPAGNRNEHGTWHDGGIQIFAYGAQVTVGGIGQYFKHPIFYPGLFVDGIGDSTPNGQNPTQPWYSRLTQFTNSTDFTYVCADLSKAFNNTNGNAWAGGGNGNLESAYNATTNARPYVSSVTRQVLFPHKKYVVLYDTFQTTNAATFQWKWNVMETNNLTVNTNVGAFSYTSTNFYNGSNVTVYVQHIANTNGLTMLNLLGTNYCVTNPFTHEDFSSSATLTSEPKWNATEWVYNTTKSTNWHFMSVVYPAKWGQSAPTITRISDNTVEVNDGVNDDVISFGETSTSPPSTFIINTAISGGGGQQPQPVVIYAPFRIR